MIERYFEGQDALKRLRSLTIGSYVDSFALSLHEKGYAYWTVRGCLRAVSHLGCWLDRIKVSLALLDDDVVLRFKKHLRRCRCFRQNRGVFAPAIPGARLFMAHLRELGVIAAPKVQPAPTRLRLIASFRTWMHQHRGVTSSTLDVYERLLAKFIAFAGMDPTRYTPERIQRFVLSCDPKYGRSMMGNIIASLRAFLRYLIAEGLCTAGLDNAVPKVARWGLESLPKYLQPPDVERLIASCDTATPQGLRDRAMLLLLARLGLRAGDVAALRFEDIDWAGGSVRFSGKERREIRLPLPQDVGDAISAYIDHGRGACNDTRIFLRAKAPHRPFRTYMAVSASVETALRRTGIAAPSRGSHLLRHSAATAMLRAGATLEAIGTVLRHRSIQTTALYTKVDRALLMKIAQPWPGGAR